MRLLTRSISGFVLSLLLAGAVEAQFDQYTAPGGPAGRPIDRKGQLAKEVESARFRFGAVRVAPTFGLRDAAYVKDLVGSAGGSARGDFTATVTAGLRAYLPSGPQVTWTAYALPEYVWWQRLTERRRFDGLYGVGFNGFWNRLTVQASAGSDAQQQVITPEILRPTSARQEHGELAAELQVSGAVSAFVAGSVRRQHSLANLDDPQADLLAELDHDEKVVRGGLRWRPPGGWVVGLAAERSDVDFTDRRPGAIDRSNSGTAPVLELSHDRGRFYFQADVAARSLTAKQGATFAKFDRTTGHATAAWEITRTAEVFVYANRNLVYSVLADISYLEDQRQGTALHLKLGHRTTASVFGETGALDYTAIGSGLPRRRDDLTAFGGTLSFDLAHGAALRVQGSHTRFASPLPGGDRTLNTVGMTVTFTGGVI